MAAVPFVVGRHANNINGSARADTSGTRSIREEFAQRVFTSGLQPNAYCVRGGRRTPIVTDCIPIRSTPDENHFAMLRTGEMGID
jgi:hypothetical protein